MISILQDMYKNNPEKWMELWDQDFFTENSNCYSYAVCNPWTYFNLGEFMNPGFGKNPNIHQKKRTTYHLANGLISDGLTHIPTNGKKDIPKLKNQASYLVAVFVSLKDLNEHIPQSQLKQFLQEKPFSQREIKSYHIIRQHFDGTWSFKDGNEGTVKQAVTSPDGTYPVCSHINKSPAFFLGYFSIPTNGLNFGIPSQLYGLSDKINNQKRIKSHTDIVNYLIDFNRLLHIDDTQTGKKRTLDCLIRGYPEIISNFGEILKKDNGEWQNDIFNSLEDAHKPLLHKVRDRFFIKR